MADLRDLNKEQLRKIKEALDELGQRFTAMGLAAQWSAARWKRKLKEIEEKEER